MGDPPFWKFIPLFFRQLLPEETPLRFFVDGVKYLRLEKFQGKRGVKRRSGDELPRLLAVLEIFILVDYFCFFCIYPRVVAVHPPIPIFLSLFSNLKRIERVNKEHKGFKIRDSRRKPPRKIGG